MQIVTDQEQLMFLHLGEAHKRWVTTSTCRKVSMLFLFPIAAHWLATRRVFSRLRKNIVEKEFI